MKPQVCVAIALSTLLPEVGKAQPLKIYGQNPRYLEYKGKPVLLITSAEHYGAVVNLDFDYGSYLETLHREGFNYTRVFTGTYIEPVENIFGIRQNTLAPREGRFIAPWMKVHDRYDLSRFNPEYFERFRDFMKEAESRGILVEVTLFTSLYAESAWVLSPFHIDNNINGVDDLDFKMVNTLFNGKLKAYQEAFVRKMARELNEFGNFFFELQNEPWADNPNLVDLVNMDDDSVFTRSWQKRVEVANGLALDWQAWVASLIRDEESKLPRSHLVAQNISNYQYEMRQIPDGVSILNYHYADPEAVIRNKDLGVVVGLDETGFMPHNDLVFICQAWRFILSGGGLYNNLDYSFTANNETGTWPIPDSNPGWGGSAFRQKLSYLENTMKGVPFAHMEYSDSILRSTGKGLKQYGLEKPGEVYLVYMERFNNESIMLNLPAGKYTLAWLNIETGEKVLQTLGPDRQAPLRVPFRTGQVVLTITNQN